VVKKINGGPLAQPIASHSLADKLRVVERIAEPLALPTPAASFIAT
jgi:hypothetical protein